MHIYLHRHPRWSAEVSATRPIQLPADPPYRPGLADLAGMVAFGTAVFIFIWWLRFWLGGLIWLATLAGVGR